MEDHHVLAPKAKIREKFGVMPWFVPVHASDFPCHRERLQDYADQAGRSLLEAAEAVHLDTFEDLCKGNFVRGNLAACMLLRNYALLHAVKQGDPTREHLIFALNAAAGCGLGMSFLKRLESRNELSNLMAEIDTQLYVASVDVNSGDLPKARKAFGELATRIPRVRRAASKAYAKHVRMTAITEPNHTTAKEALEIARDSPDRVYHYRTAKFALASAFEKQREYSSARAQAEDLASHFISFKPSQWHQIQQRFLWGRTTILSDGSVTISPSIRTAFKHLILAQYAAAFLDFRGLPAPDYRSASNEPELTNLLTPTEVIHWFGRRYGLSKVQMIDIRREAILGDASPKSLEDFQPSGFQDIILRDLVSRDLPR